MRQRFYRQWHLDIDKCQQLPMLRYCLKIVCYIVTGLVSVTVWLDYVALAFYLSNSSLYGNLKINCQLLKLLWNTLAMNQYCCYLHPDDGIDEEEHCDQQDDIGKSLESVQGWGWGFVGQQAFETIITRTDDIAFGESKLVVLITCVCCLVN